ncbi:MAG: hypothetical protein ACSLE1_03075 [Sphingobium sp.]
MPHHPLNQAVDPLRVVATIKRTDAYAAFIVIQAPGKDARLVPVS